MLIKRCPSCGSENIKKVQGDLTREYEGKAYVVPQVTYYACSACGEQIYGPEAVRKIQAASPAFRRRLVKH